MKLWMLSLVLPFVLLSSQACKSSKKKNNPPPSVPTNVETPTGGETGELVDTLIGQEMLNLIDAKCVSCHGPDKKEGGLDFTQRSVVRDRAEDIVASILDGSMPVDQQLTAEEKQLAEAWRDDNFSLPKQDNEEGPTKDENKPDSDKDKGDSSKDDGKDSPDQNEDGPSKDEPSQNGDDKKCTDKKKLFCDWISKYEHLKNKYAAYCAK